MPPSLTNSKPINKKTATILAFFWGGLGLHKFYLKKNKMGILYLLFCWTYIPLFLGFIEGIILIRMNKDEFYRRYCDSNNHINNNNTSNINSTNAITHSTNAITISLPTNTYKSNSNFISNCTNRNLLTKKWSQACFNEFVVIDLETTGLSGTDDYIIEIAAIRFQKGSEINKFFTFIKPPIEIPQFITKINGITNEMVTNAPKIEDVIHSLMDFIKDSIIVAHNSSFDMKFIEYNASKNNIKITNDVIDTLKACRKLYPGFKNHKLKNVCECLDIDCLPTHRARDDARACAQVVYKCIEKFNKINSK